MGWFVCGFQFDPSLHEAMVWPKKRGFLKSVWTTDGTGCAFSQKIACDFEKKIKPHAIFWVKAQLVATVTKTDPKKPLFFCHTIAS